MPWTWSALAVLALPAAAPAARPVEPPSGCVVMGMKTEGRRSPLDSLSFSVGKSDVKVCYGRPAARGRTMLGGAVPFGQLWRTGANEPTMIHTSGPIVVAGIKLGAGSYSLYSVPGKEQWTIIVNRSIKQWGAEGGYTDEIAKQEAGRGTAAVEAIAEAVESFTIRVEPTHGARALLLEWEKTRVRVPISDK